LRLVIDTNIFFSALNPKSRYYPISSNILSGRFSLLVSTPILLEYEEILQRVFPQELMEHFWLFLLTSENVIYVSPAFRFRIPFEDEDDEKFVDCAVCGSANFLITNDRHYNRLKDIAFPKVKVIKAEDFIEKHIYTCDRINLADTRA
jgi:uncharacterized protein